MSLKTHQLKTKLRSAILAAFPAVYAHARHGHSVYDQLVSGLASGSDRRRLARLMVASEVERVVATWRMPKAASRPQSTCLGHGARVSKEGAS